jgi:hypothetical protein
LLLRNMTNPLKNLFLQNIRDRNECSAMKLHPDCLSTNHGTTLLILSPVQGPHRELKYILCLHCPRASLGQGQPTFPGPGPWPLRVGPS